MRTRTIQKHFWFSYEEYERLKYLSRIQKLSEADTIRNLLYTAEIKESPSVDFYEHINKLHKQMNEIINFRKFSKIYEDINIDEINKLLTKLDVLVDDIYDEYL